MIHDKKLDALEDMIEAANGKLVLVVYWFKHDLKRIMLRLTEKKIPFEKLDSDSSIEKWNRGEIPMALIHPASAGHGLNLQSGGNTLDERVMKALEMKDNTQSALIDAVKAAVRANGK